MRTEIAVVGGGAAGLIAAVFAARGGRRVVLLEKNRRPGLKILISGGGRCNLTTTRSGRDLEAQYGPRRGRWLRHALRAFPPKALIEFVEAAGVPLQAEDLDKIFPVSGRAGDVLEAFLRLAAQAGVEISLAAPMRSLAVAPNGDWVIGTTVDDPSTGAPLGPSGLCRAQRVILATGGLSYPKTGATGDGYEACRQLGHQLIEPRPALAPLLIEEVWVRQLAGVTLVDVELTLRGPTDRVIRRRRRPVLFTHQGLTGPAAMDLAGDVEAAADAEAEALTLSMDFVPDLSAEQLDAELQTAARTHGRRSVANCLPRVIPERLRQRLVASAITSVSTSADVRSTGPVAELRKSDRRRLVALVKGSRVRVSRSLGFRHAEVTRGGVPLEEVDARTMESKLATGLYLCGELLDVDGPIGGFNFQAAFATGRLAGIHAARSLGSSSTRRVGQ